MSISTIGENAGRGIFAGRDYEQHEQIEEGQTFIIKNDDGDKQLKLYLFNCYDDNIKEYAMYIFGVTMMFNSHLTMSNIEYIPSPLDELKPSPLSYKESTPNANHTDISALTKRPIRKGEEFLSSYGYYWYRDRNLTPPLISIPSNKLMISPETEYKRVCRSDVFVAGSTVYGADRGLFANCDFITGELVTVSSMIVSKKSYIDHVAKGDRTKNYYFWDGQAPIVLMLILVKQHLSIINWEQERMLR